MSNLDIWLGYIARLENVLGKAWFFRVLDSLVFDVEKPYVRISFRLPFSVDEGVVVDVETTGLPERIYDSGLEVTEMRGDAHLVSFGLMERNILYCYGLWKPSEWDWFERICCNLLKNKKPLYAYSASFEECFLGFKGNWKDLLEWGVGYSEWNDEYYSYRKSLRQAAYDYGLRSYFTDTDGSQIPYLWRRFVNHANFKCLWEIMYHNSVDVIRLGWITWRKEKQDGEKQ